MKTEHILIIRFSAMGDVAMTVPVVWALAQQYPHVRITVLSRPFARTFYENLAPNVSFMAADIKGEYRGVKGLNALFRRLIAKRFTAIADLHDILRSKYLRLRFNLAHYHVAHINKHRSMKRNLTRQQNKVMRQLPTSFENYAEVFAKLGYPIQLEGFKSIFSPKSADLSTLPEAIGEKRRFQQWIGVAPFAAHPGKIYPIERMEQVIAQVIERHPSCRIFLFGGGKSEMEVFNRWVATYPQCTCASSVLGGLQQELVLMSHLNVMLSMDSANLHLASLVGTPVVSVWGATHPYAGFMGWGQSTDNAVQIDLPCRPCSVYGSKPCVRGDFACMNQIEPADIMKRLEKFLEI